MTAYKTNAPAGSESPRNGDDAIRNLAAAGQEINDINHYWPVDSFEVSDADKGKHRYCQFVDALTSGSFTDKSLAVTSGEDALVYKGTQAEVELVMSSDALQSGSLCLDGGILRNDKKLQFINTSGDALVDMIEIESYLASGDVTKDRVIMKDGLRVDGEVCMSGNLITAVADPISDQDAATKAYVDLRNFVQVVSREDSEGNNMVKSHAYLAQVDGFVSAIMPLDNGEYLRGYIHSTNNPAGAGTKVQETRNASDRNSSIFMAVPAGWYFEITTDNAGVEPEIYWQSIGSNSKPVDQD